MKHAALVRWHAAWPRARIRSVVSRPPPSLLGSATAQAPPAALCTPQRFVGTQRISRPRSLSPPAARMSASGAWHGALRDALHSLSSPVASHNTHLSAPVVAQLAESCLDQEGRRLYAVYRPCRVPPSDAVGPSPPALSTPEDFVRLLRTLAAFDLAPTYGPRVARVLLELLRKPLHPQYGVLGPWDLTVEQTGAITGEAVHLACTALSGPAALAWLDTLFLCRRVDPEVASASAADSGACGEDESAVPRADRSLVCVALRERLARYPHATTASASVHTIALDAPGAEALLCTPSVVACVAAALIRTGAAACKQEALAILELAASARFSTGMGESVHGGRGSGDGRAALFSEDVVVECAEAAAVMGDSETVTRLTFLLYRCRGALGAATLSARADQTRHHRRHTTGRAPSSSLAAPTSSSPRFWTRLVAPLASTATSRLNPGVAEAADVEAWDDASATGPEDDIRFERAAVRMLKAVIRAALRHPTADRTGETPELTEALALFEALRTGTSWAGTAAMAVELLTFLSATVQQSDPLVVLSGPVRLECQRQALYLLSVLLGGASSSARQSDGQRKIIAVCVERVMEVLLESHARAGGDSPAVPTVVPAQAPLVLGLFGLVAPEHQASLLPHALAAVVAVLAAPSPAPPSDATGAVIGNGLDSPTLHSSLRALLQRDPGPSLPALLRPVSRFFVTPMPVLERVSTYIGTNSPSPSSGALLLLLSLLLRFHERQASAVAEREALGALAVLSAAHDELWCVAGAASRELVWQWLLHPSTAPQVLSHGGCDAPVDAIATVSSASTTMPSTEELTQMLRTLYMYPDSHARPLVDTLLTRLFGFTILTRTTTDVVGDAKARATSASPGCAVVVLGASTARAHPTSWSASRDSSCSEHEFVGRLHAFLRDAVESSGVPALSAARRGKASATRIIVVLTIDALLALLPAAASQPRSGAATDADSRLIGPVAAALSVQLRGLAPPSSEAAIPVALEVAVLAPLDAGRPASFSLPPADGVVECTALAQELARQLSLEQRAPLFFWNEGSTGCETVRRPAFAASGGVESESDADVERWVARHRIRLLSVRRVVVERAKRDVISLLRPGAHSTPTSVSPTRGSRLTVVGPEKSAKALSGDMQRNQRFQR